jgi:hypothetical protein
MQPGMVVMVTEGDTYADTPWKLTTNGTIVIGETALTFQQFATGGSGTPGGSNTQVQFNNGGNFGGSANLTWNGTELAVTGNVSANYFIGDGSQLTGISGGNIDLSAVDQDIIPTANITYDLGNTTHRWRDIYLSGNTIDLGGAKIKTDDTTGAFALIPAVTAETPNPVATVITGSGGISKVETSGGDISESNIANVAINSSEAIMYFSTQITANLTVPANTNALSAGPITITNGVEVTVPPGSEWTVV